MTLLLILALTFVATWLGVMGLGLVLVRPRLADERLASITMDGLGDEAAPTENDSLLAPFLEGGFLAERARLALWRAGMTIRPTDFLAGVLLVGLVAAGAVMLLTHHVLLGLGAGIAGSLVPVLVLVVRQNQRQARFEAQLPDMLSLLVSSLRSGYSFQQALGMVAQEMPTPVSEEARRVIDEVALGVDLEEALARLVDRVRSYDVDLMVTAVSIQHRVGGNLGQLLDTIGETIRGRVRTRMEIAGLTAEGRLSATILTLLPIALLGILYVRSPEYILPLFVHPMGQAMLIGAVVLQGIGALVLSRMLKVDA